MNPPAITPNEVEEPIINSPFAEPAQHWLITRGQPPVKVPGRRAASYDYRVPGKAARGRKKAAQLSLIADAEIGELEELHLVNRARQLVRDWRVAGYPGASAVTRELLELWTAGSDRRGQRLFFAQIEAAETILFLVEAPEAYRRGLPPVPLDQPGTGTRAAGFRAFTRYACKMATGTGKTTVMGMLIAWSILNRLAEPTDDRFSDTVLVVCPNVTIRERLKELDPALGDLSLYRTRQLVPPHRMEDLRRGEVMVTNWHRLAKLETNAVNGTAASVVRTGEATAVTKNAGKANETREIRYYESDRAWIKRIRQELGSGRGRSPHWLVFNDEAHHAYRRGDVPDTRSFDETEDEDRGALARKNAREATVWIEGLDRINRLAAGGGARGRKGIRLCIDLSATPFYIQGSGNEVGRPFPWIVSDFGLLDAIESGLVKVPQLPARDITGAAEAGYFNIWRWVEARAEQDGQGTRLTPELVMTYATAPINQLAEDWHTRFTEWSERQRGALHRVPPVFIVVCRDTRIANAVHAWLAEGQGAAAAPPWFRNAPGQEVTVRIDSRVIEDMEAGGTRDETRRLRFMLAREVVRRWQQEQAAPRDDGTPALPAQTLFPVVVAAARRLLGDPAKLICKGGSQAVDVLLVNRYAQSAVDHLFEALRRGTRVDQSELPRIPIGTAGRGSTAGVDFCTTKPIYPANRCHLNAMAADTVQWEQSAAFALDTHPRVLRWVKNEHLGLRIPYRKNGVPRTYIPDFIVVLLTAAGEELILLIEIKGQYDDDADLKCRAAERWVAAVNRTGDWGTWCYRVIEDPPAVLRELDALAGTGTTGHIADRLSGRQ